MDNKERVIPKRPAIFIDSEQCTDSKKPKLEQVDNKNPTITKPKRYEELNKVANDAKFVLAEANQLLQNMKNGQSNEENFKQMMDKLLNLSKGFVLELSSDQVKNSQTQASDMRVVLKHLPTDWSKDRLLAFLKKKDLNFKNVEKEEGSGEAYVEFETVDDEGRMFRILDGFKIQDKWVTVYKSSSPDGDDGNEDYPRSLRGIKMNVEQTHRKKGFSQDGGSLRNIRDLVTPYWVLPYKEQLMKKQSKLVDELKRVTKGVTNSQTENLRPQWLKNLFSKGLEKSTCCPIEGILQSPQLKGYRNKVEFTIGYDIHEQPTVGFLLGAFKDGVTAVAEATGCVNISSTSIQVASIIQNYIRDKSNLKPWDKRVNKGFWRLLIVRGGRTQTFLPLPGNEVYEGKQGEEISFKNFDWKKWMVRIEGEEEQGCHQDTSKIVKVDEVVDDREPTPPIDEIMLVVQVNHKAASKEKVQAELVALESHFKEHIKGENIPKVIIMLVQYHSGVSNSAFDWAALVPFPSEESRDVSEMVIMDTLLNLKFQISFKAFFQVNSGAASCLYALVGEWAQVGPKTLLLDVCCGTGTIGLTLARMAKRVIGVDSVKSAIEDANTNSAINNIDNCKWVFGTAEKCLSDVLKQYQSQVGVDKEYEDIVAIVDPPRAGLHKQVINAILGCEVLKRLVYVSCNPETLANNLVKLCSPKQFQKGNGFKSFWPVKAMAVDLFPHTKHCEGVVLLQRD